MAAESRLKAAARNKIDPRLLLWLDGKETAWELGFGPAKRESGDVAAVGVEFTAPLSNGEAKAFRALGLAAEPGETIAWGEVSRKSLAALALEQKVLQIQPASPVQSTTQF